MMKRTIRRSPMALTLQRHWRHDDQRRRPAPRPAAKPAKHTRAA